ncbi:MAG: DDE-type integrase/transposase/recombinase [Candidatus Pacebacteria bacterium]|nr:DDE-type integrase/transposase/recombinase [Candidatus Paceibacterota bacterium]
MKKLFYDTKTGLRSSSLYSKAKAIDPTITRALVKEFLSKQNVTQVFKPRKIKRFYPLIATKPGRIQIDLMDMSNEDTVKNKGRKWLFCAVDVFSRYAFCFPQTSKSDMSYLESLKSLIKDCKEVGIVPYQIDSDSESSFMSRQFKALLKANDITQNLVPVGDKHRVGIVERFNGTVRMFLNRYKTVYKTTDWLSVIPDFLTNYNTTVHSTLDGQTPKEAIEGTGATSHMFNQTLDASEETYKERFSVGDKVRLRRKHALFEKRSTGVWTKTIHTVEEIKGSDIYVDDRVEPYRKENLLKVNESENVEVVDDRMGEEEKSHTEQIVERRITRRMNKEGVEKQGESTEEEKNERALQTERIFRAYDLNLKK